ncbi:MAG TPA: hypothetical protein VMG40_01440 [Bryobacteraceae bacterium]|nr:hypothetical protein [Bryobacteraceae bacterium]
MRKYIREMIDDIRRKHPKDFTPPIPKPSAPTAEENLMPAPVPTTPSDLENQVLSKNNLERVRQLDFQAQEQEEGVPLD